MENNYGFPCLLVLAVIIGSIVLSAWKQISMSVIAGIACVIVMMVMIIDSQQFTLASTALSSTTTWLSHLRI